MGTAIEIQTPTLKLPETVNTAASIEIPKSVTLPNAKDLAGTQLNNLPQLPPLPASIPIDLSTIPGADYQLPEVPELPDPTAIAGELLGKLPFPSIAGIPGLSGMMAKLSELAQRALPEIPTPPKDLNKLKEMKGLRA